MIRKLRYVCLFVVASALLVSSATAGTLSFGHGAAGTLVTASLEAMGTARNVTATGAGIAGGKTATLPTLSYLLGQNLTSGNLLQVTFTGASFTGDQINACTSNGPDAGGAANVLIATGTPTQGATTYNFQTNIPAASANATLAGNFVWFTNGACANATGPLPIKLTATAVGQTATVNVKNLTSGGIEVDPGTAVNIATIGSEWAITNYATTHTIDYLATPGDGTRIITNALAANLIADSASAFSATSNSVTFAQTAKTYGMSTGAQNAAISVRAVVSLQDTASWQGVTSAWLVLPSEACGAANTVGAAITPGTTTTVTLSPAAAAFNGAATTGFAVCVKANGTEALQARTITASGSMTSSGTGFQAPTASTYSTVQSWGLNAYQAIIPWAILNSSASTYCLINNNGSATATALLDIVSSEPGTTILNGNLGTLATKTSKMVVFDGTQAIMYTGVAPGTAGTPVSLSTLTANSRYSPRFTVTSNPMNITVTCNQTDPNGSVKRNVPVLTTDGTNAYKQ